MKSNQLLLALFIPILLLIGWTCFLGYQRQSGSEVIVTITGYDPRDLLSGHYIAYQVDWDKTDCTQFPDQICPQNQFCRDASWGRQCRFYIPERYASHLEKLFRNRWFNHYRFEVVYSYTPNSQPIAKRLLINGKSWRKFVK